MTPTELVASTGSLLSFPDVYFQVNDMVDDPRCSAADIGKVISQDPGLTIRLLKIVNSPFYGLSSRVETVSRAVNVIGMRELRNLVLVTAAVETFSRVPHDLVDMATFWRHSVYCGVVARLLASRCNVLHSERLFVAGLLHDIGMLIIYHRLPDEARQIIEQFSAGSEEIYRIEQAVMGFDHAQLGGELMRSWLLPPSLQATATFHHEPTKADDFRLECAITHIANGITNAAQADEVQVEKRPFSIPFIPQLRAAMTRRRGVDGLSIEAEAWQITGLSPDCVPAIRRAADDNYDAALDLIYPGL